MPIFGNGDPDHGHKRLILNARSARAVTFLGYVVDTAASSRSANMRIKAFVASDEQSDKQASTMACPIHFIGFERAGWLMVIYVTLLRSWRPDLETADSSG